jgi:hypothetical protein
MLQTGVVGLAELFTNWGRTSTIRDPPPLTPPGVPRGGFEVACPLTRQAATILPSVGTVLWC